MANIYKLKNIFKIQFPCGVFLDSFIIAAEIMPTISERKNYG